MLAKFEACCSEKAVFITASTFLHVNAFFPPLNTISSPNSASLIAFWIRAYFIPVLRFLAVGNTSIEWTAYQKGCKRMLTILECDRLSVVVNVFLEDRTYLI